MMNDISILMEEILSSLCSRRDNFETIRTGKLNAVPSYDNRNETLTEIQCTASLASKITNKDNALGIINEESGATFVLRQTETFEIYHQLQQVQQDKSDLQVPDDINNEGVEIVIDEYDNPNMFYENNTCAGVAEMTTSTPKQKFLHGKCFSESVSPISQKSTKENVDEETDGFFTSFIHTPSGDESYLNKTVDEAIHYENRLELKPFVFYKENKKKSRVAYQDVSTQTSFSKYTTVCNSCKNHVKIEEPSLSFLCLEYPPYKKLKIDCAIKLQQKDVDKLVKCDFGDEFDMFKLPENSLEINRFKDQIVPKLELSQENVKDPVKIENQELKPFLAELISQTRPIRVGLSKRAKLPRLHQKIW